MHEFNIGDWVYAGDYVYGQIVEFDDDYAWVEFDTGSGGGTLTFALTDLQPAEPPKETKFIVMPKYAVTIIFSYDPEVSVLLFNTRDEALVFIKNDILKEYEIDINENGLDAEYQIFESEGRAVLTTQYSDGPGTVEWRIGVVYDPDIEHHSRCTY